MVNKDRETILKIIDELLSLNNIAYWKNQQHCVLGFDKTDVNKITRCKSNCSHYNYCIIENSIKELLNIL